MKALSAAVAVSVGLGIAATPAAAATGAHQHPVRAVVVVRPGVSLPLAVPGGRVTTVLRNVGAEVVTAPSVSCTALRAARKRRSDRFLAFAAEVRALRHLDRRTW